MYRHNIKKKSRDKIGDNRRFFLNSINNRHLFQYIYVKNKRIGGNNKEKDTIIFRF